MDGQNKIKINPRVKDILKLIGAGIIVSSAILVPGTAVIGKLVLDGYDKYKASHEEKNLGVYKLWRVRQIIQRLEKQKMIKIQGNIIQITKAGKRRLLQYDLQEMKLNEKVDGKWRIVIYDIEELNLRQRKIFQMMLRKLKFFQLQKSVYLTPFPCEDEIEYLRQRFNIGKNVQMIVSTGLENAEAYKAYFGL